MTYEFSALWLELGVLAVAGVVFTADLLMGEKRGLGALGAIGLAGLLVASFFVDLNGAALFNTYLGDDTSMFFKRVLLLAGTLGCIGSIDHVDRFFPKRQGEHYLMLLFSLSGMLLLTGAQDLVLWVVGFELAGIPLSVMAAMTKDKRSSEGALKLFLSGAASTAVTLYGISFLWGLSGDTTFASLAAVPASPLFALGALLVLAGIAFKVGLVPFHLWVADTYESAPAPAVAFMSVAPKIAVVASLARLLGTGLSGHVDIWVTPLLALAVLTLVVGNVTAVTQKDARRLLALSGVGHMGLMFLALVVGTPEAYGALMFYSLGYVATNMGAFFAVGMVADERGGLLKSFNGLIKTAPALSVAILIFLFSLGGIPFLIGFWAKLFVFWSAWIAGFELVVFLGVLIAVLGLFYYLRLARAIFIEPSTDDTPVPVGWPSLVAVGLTALLTVGLGLAPGPFIEAAIEAAGTLLQ
ncbi:MAG: NADH-quinone oxidoreductase subunit N [Proteobacteria bacterium]|nr:NADH-quinone oxidoreductase subunit N [Pseudomonadota bacterium]MCP4915664.1 NADH-quinone oxidoreductase subunit N [Pseudomonadota bacterium]